MATKTEMATTATDAKHQEFWHLLEKTEPFSPEDSEKIGELAKGCPALLETRIEFAEYMSNTPLQYTASEGKLHALSALVEHVTDITLLDEALLSACTNSQTAAARILIENGADAKGLQKRLQFTVKDKNNTSTEKMISRAQLGTLQEAMGPSCSII